MVKTMQEKVFEIPSVEQQRQELREKEITAKEFYRILHIGRYAFGKTDIVSRMKQALENLGHTVFDFNTDDFKEVIYNPEKLTGGFGPIEIKLEYIKPILRQFKPQIIICNAGGYTFSEEDSKWLKDRGYILVGITLSDPDVFPGTKKFAHRFDYHVTNAIEAIEMYEKVGIKNTMHFPFAIDRSFIEADAVYRKDWEADVICIGNATNREDRNTMMKYLAKHFDVRVYGTGWDFPGSFSVSGENFFSAARAGKFHINFPGTRAGYTNVKIGVFESIANGGILCTEYFDEMNLFFEYDKEIIGYKDAEDLKNKIEYYLEHPEEAEQIRRRAFKKLVEKHLWESRWNDLFTLIEEDINVKKERLSQERYRQIGELRGSKEKAAKVIIQGYYGAHNTGDDLILEAIADNLKKRWPNIHIMVAGFGFKNITLEQGFYSLPRTDIFRMDKFVKTADLLIYGGGGLLNDYTFNNSAGVADFFDGFPVGITGMGIIPTMANIHEVPTMYFALGVGPLENPEARKFAKFLVNQMDIVTVRDEYSKQLLNSIDGINKEVIQTSDPTYMLEYPGSDLANAYFAKNGISESEQIIAVSLRDWKGNPVDFEDKMASYFDSILKSNPKFQIVFLPFQFGRGKSDDNLIHQRVLDKMKYNNRTHIYRHTGDYIEFLSILGSAHVVISMRLHGSILANRFFVPSIGFNYDDKVLAHYQNMGTEDFLLGLDFNLDLAIEKFNDIQKNRENISNLLAENINKERNKSSLTFEYAVELLQKGLAREKEVYKYYPREESLRSIKEKALNKEILELKKKQSNLSIPSIKQEIIKSLIRNKENTEVVNDIEQLLDGTVKKVIFDDVIFECENEHLKKEIVTDYTKNQIGIRLSNLDAPKKKDFSSAKLYLDVDPKYEYILSLNVFSPYYRPQNKGRIAYSIYLDGEKVYREDIAVDGDRKLLTFKFKPNSSQAKLEFRLEALKNCENWSWGSASKTYFYDANIIKFKSQNNSTRNVRKGFLKRLLSRN